MLSFLAFCVTHFLAHVHFTRFDVGLNLYDTNWMMALLYGGSTGIGR